MLINKLLEGKNVKLTSFEKEYLPAFEAWYNDTGFLRYYDFVSAFPKSRIQLDTMLTDTKLSSDKYIFAVKTLKEDKFVGVTGFEDILWNNGTATIYIGIGENEFRGRGIGKEALALTIEFGFSELNLHRIQLNVLSYNESAIALYEGLRFKREGTYREFAHRDGKRYDMYLYGILRSEWKSYL